MMPDAMGQESHTKHYAKAFEVTLHLIWVCKSRGLLTANVLFRQRAERTKDYSAKRLSRRSGLVLMSERVDPSRHYSLASDVFLFKSANGIQQKRHVTRISLALVNCVNERLASGRDLQMLW